MNESLDKLMNNIGKGNLKVENPDLMMRSLKKLQSLVGNNDVKESVVNYIYYYVHTKAKGHKFQKKQFNHCIIYGPPGTGKTTLAYILAGVWASLGVLPNKNHDKNRICTRDGTSSNGGYVVKYDMNTILTCAILLVIVYYVLVEIDKKTTSNVEEFPSSLTIICIISIIVTVMYTNMRCPASKRTGNSNMINCCGDAPERYNFSRSSSKRDSEDEEEDLVVVVSPSSFIGQYVGLTEVKTNEILNRSLGKVLFIDEAYSIARGENSSFGASAVDVIVDFLDKHPGELVVIFAGYKDKIENGLLKINSGLNRRFPWKFSCGKYSYEDLYAILEIKMKENFLAVSPQDKLAFKEQFYKGSFPNYGGSIDNLVVYMGMSLAKRTNGCFNPRENGMDMVTPVDMVYAVKTIRMNSIEKEKDKEKEETESEKYREQDYRIRELGQHLREWVDST